MAFRFSNSFSSQMEKKNSIAKYVIRLTVIRWVHLEFFLVIFPWCIPMVKVFPTKLASGVFPSQKMVGVAPTVIFGAPVYIVTMYLSGPKEPSHRLRSCR